ncbi:hypothetical protein DVH05_027524 [Phytophthora capsici]|nr:hypothetical protein DVH05_027524 [Phytophthora capsici]
MDVILSRAGLSAVQQRSVCFGAVQDEARTAEVKLAEAISYLKRLYEVVRVARDVHNAQKSVVTLPSNTEASIKEMSQTNENIGPMLREIQSMLNAFTLSSRTLGPTAYSSEEEDEEEEEDLDTLSPVGDTNHTIAKHRATTARHPHPSEPSGPSLGWTKCTTPTTSATPTHFRREQHKPTKQLACSNARRTSSNGPDGLPATTQVVGQKRRATSPPRPAGHSFIRPAPPVSRPLGAPEGLLYPRKAEHQGIWPRHNQFQVLHRRAWSPVPQSEKKIAQIVDDLEKRLSRLSGSEQDAVFSKSFKDALKIAPLSQIKGEEAYVQVAVNSARAATKELLKRAALSPNSEETPYRLEDLRQVMSVVVRAVLDTDGKLEGSGLRDLLTLVKKLQDAFTPSTSRFQWCNTQLRKFITRKYKRPGHISRADRKKLATFLSEAKGWESVNDYYTSRFKEIMSFVSELLEGKYEEWESREDSELAELIGIIIIRLGAFKDSQAQLGRLY